MRKVNVEITENEYNLLYIFVLRHSKMISNIENSNVLNDDQNTVFEFLAKVESKFKGKKKFGKIDFKNELVLRGCSEQDVNDWCEIRKVFTKRSLDSFIRECENNSFPIDKAVKIAADKGWKGFEVKWCNNFKYGKEVNSHTTEPYIFDINRATKTLVSQSTRGLSSDTE